MSVFPKLHKGNTIKKNLLEHHHSLFLFGVLWMEVIRFDLITSTSLTCVDWIFLPQHGEQAPPESKRGACEQEGQKHFYFTLYTFWLLSERVMSDGLYKGRLIFPSSLPNQCRELSSPWPRCRPEAEHLELLWRTRGIILYRLCRELWEAAFLRLVPVIMYLISVWPSASKPFTAYVFHTLVEVHWSSSRLTLPAAQTESLSALACFEIPVWNHCKFTEEQVSACWFHVNSITCRYWCLFKHSSKCIHTML